MCTATLLILATRVRDHARHDRRVAPRVEPCLSLRPGLAGMCLLLLSQTLQAVQTIAGAGARHSNLRARVFDHGQAKLRARVLRHGLVRCGVVPAWFLLSAMLAGSSATVARAQTNAPEAAPPASTSVPASGRIGGETPSSLCVVVDIAGHKVGHLDCASQKLEAAARTAQAQARAPIDTPVIDATSPDVRTGVANQTATRQRMGSSFGTSVQPQRPNRAPSVPRPGSQP